MIEVTDEMVQEIYSRIDFVNHGDGGIREGLTAVLAVVERDYEPIRCDTQSWAGHRCTNPRGHGGQHHHKFSGVVWP